MTTESPTKAIATTTMGAPQVRNSRTITRSAGPAVRYRFRR